MFKFKRIYATCLLSLCAFGGCSDDGFDSRYYDGYPYEVDAQSCECETPECENCAVETASCEDNMTIKFTSKISGYYHGEYILRYNSRGETCTSGQCVPDELTGAHCGAESSNTSSNALANCMCEDNICNNCADVIKTICVNGLSMGKLESTILVDGVTPSGTHITNTSLVGTDCKKNCVQDTETTAHCLEDEESGDSVVSVCQCEDLQCWNCAEVTSTSCMKDPEDSQLKLAKYVTIRGFYGMVDLTKNTVVLEECELGTTCNAKSINEAICN